MQAKLIKISQLKNNSGQIEGLPKNPRILKDDKYKKLVTSIKEDPEMLELREVIAYDNDGELVVIAGNMRLKACKEAGLDEVPTKILPKDTPVDKLKRYTIKDNNSFGEWSYDDLANEWDAEELDEWGLDTPDDWGDDKEVDEDEAPEVSDEPPVSKLGEVYQLGRHRVICGDSTDLELTAKLMDDNKADLILTDPPYNMAYTGSATARRKPIENDKMNNFGEFVNDFMAAMVASAKSSAPYYVFTSEPEIKTIKDGFIANGLKPSQTIIWKKHRIGFGGSDYQHQYEPLVYGWKSHKERYMVDKRNLSDVWEFSRPHKSEEHPTMKPIDLLAHAINNSSKSDDIVLDLFLGSGSTLIACEQTDRTCYGMELDCRYIDVIIRRFIKFTNGEQPVIRLSDGKDVRDDYSVI